MTDRYEKIRKALAMGPTPGPWSVRYDYVVQAKSFDEGRLVPIAQPYGLRVDASDLFANAAHIVACDPDTIRALLEERDALAKDAAKYRWGINNARWIRSEQEAYVAIPVAQDADLSCVAMRDAAIDQARGKAGQEVGDA